jgi:hypothetical protein
MREGVRRHLSWVMEGRCLLQHQNGRELKIRGKIPSVLAAECLGQYTDRRYWGTAKPLTQSETGPEVLTVGNGQVDGDGEEKRVCPQCECKSFSCG